VADCTLEDEGERALDNRDLQLRHIAEKRRKKNATRVKIVKDKTTRTHNRSSGTVVLITRKMRDVQLKRNSVVDVGSGTISPRCAIVFVKFMSIVVLMRMNMSMLMIYLINIIHSLLIVL
jgi:hypothetical protein